VLWPHDANNGGAREDNEASGRGTGARTARAGLGSASTSVGTEGRWAPHRGCRGGHGEGSAGCNALYLGVEFFSFYSPNSGVTLFSLPASLLLPNFKAV
jgi:hypothetical protein